MLIVINKVSETYLKIDCDERVSIEISNHFQFYAKGYSFDWRFRKGVWDGKLKLFSPQKRHLYVGLLAQLQRFLNHRGYPYKLVFDDSETSFSVVEARSFVESLSLPHEVYDFQLDAFIRCVQLRRCISLMPTASGKSLCLYILSRYFKNKKQLVIVPTKNLIHQLEGDFRSYGYHTGIISKIFAGEDKTNLGDVTISTFQSIANIQDIGEFLKQFGMITVDECFHPDHELLTKDGWLPISKIDESMQVLGFDSATCSCQFEQVLAVVKRKFDGDLIELSHGEFHTITTPNHEQPIRHPKSGRIDRVVVNDLKKGVQLPIAARLAGSGYLSSLERLDIAFEADGHLLHVAKDGERTYRFMFRRQRKIIRLIELLDDLRMKYDETVNCRGDRSIVFRTSILLNKNFDWFDPLVDGSRNEQFLDELVQWDGWKNRDGSFWENLNEERVDKIQLIAQLSGFSCSVNFFLNRGKRQGRWRVHWNKKSFWLWSEPVKIQKIPYNGEVFCVSVSSTNLLTRLRNVVSVSGNCHRASAQSIVMIMRAAETHRFRFGFTGTVGSFKVDEMVLTGLFGPIKSLVTTKTLMDEGKVATLKIKTLELVHSEKDSLELRKMVRRAGKRGYFAEIDAIVVDQARNRFISNLVLSLKGNTLVLFRFLEHGKVLRDLIYSLQTEKCKKRRVFYVDGSVDGKFRDYIRQIVEEENDAIIVASIKTFGTGINIRRLNNLIAAHPMKGSIDLLQGIGRSLRLSSDKTSAVFYDIADNFTQEGWFNFGMRHLNIRREIYAKEKFNYRNYKIKMGG